jgi:hypothetical protein
MGFLNRLKASYESGKDEEAILSRHREEREKRQRIKEESEAKDNPNRAAKAVGKIAKKTEKSRSAIGKFAIGAARAAGKVAGNIVEEQKKNASQKIRKQRKATSNVNKRSTTKSSRRGGMINRAVSQYSYSRGSNRNPYDQEEERRPDPFGITTRRQNNDPFGIMSPSKHTSYNPFVKAPEVKARSKRVKTIKFEID